LQWQTSGDPEPAAVPANLRHVPHRARDVFSPADGKWEVENMMHAVISASESGSSFLEFGWLTI